MSQLTSYPLADFVASRERGKEKRGGGGGKKGSENRGTPLPERRPFCSMVTAALVSNR